MARQDESHSLQRVARRRQRLLARASLVVAIAPPIVESLCAVALAPALALVAAAAATLRLLLLLEATPANHLNH